MHDIVGSIGRGQGIAEIDEHGGAPGRAARLDVALAVTHHEALLQVNASSTAASRIMPGLGLRESQCSPLPWKQALTASRGNSRAMISCIASTSEWAIKPS